MATATPPGTGSGREGGTEPPGTVLRPTTRDDQAVAELYRKYHAPLLSFTLHLTAGDVQQAEDVVQETMIRAWRQGDRLDPAAPSLMPWLATVARHIVIDERRKKLARPAEAGAGSIEQAGVADDTDALLRKITVTEALKALSPAHREVLNETILRGRTVNEAADWLGIPVGTVKSRVYYAVRALRLILAEQGVTD